MTARVLPITVFVSAADVMRALGCSKTVAYEHLRRAARRAPGTRGLLRVPVAVWEDYLRGLASSVAHHLSWIDGLTPLIDRPCSPSGPELRGVYFVQHDGSGPIKIGAAWNIAQRVRMLQTGNPYPLHLRGYIADDQPHVLEKQLHARFAALRLGGEWFRSDPPLQAFIDEHTTRGPR